MAAEKSGNSLPLGTADKTAKPKRELPEALRRNCFKPGQSGNPGGRPKKLTQPLEDFLARKDKKGRQYAQLLIEAMVKRAIAKSDTLVKEIFDRVEGHVASAEETSQSHGNVIIVDIPRPPKMIDAGSNGHKPPSENNEDD